MRARFVVPFALALVLSGCAGLAFHPRDSAGVKTAKVLTRIPLGIATFGMSEFAIANDVYYEEVAAGLRPPPQRDPNAALGALLLLQSTRTPAPVFHYTPLPGSLNCNVVNFGNIAQVRCW